jgi:hypothetical protein
MYEKQMVIRLGKAFALKFADVSVEGRALWPAHPAYRRAAEILT